MRYLIFAVAGIAIAVGSLVALTQGIFAVSQVGTCASGGPFVIANQCPDGLGTDIMKLMGGIIGVLIGVGVFAARGRPASSTASVSGLGPLAGAGQSVGLGVAAWSMMWIAIAGAMWMTQHGEGAVPTESDGVITMLVILFGAMGVIPLILLLVGIVRGRRPITTAPLIGTVGEGLGMPGTTGAGGSLNLQDLVRQAQELARQQRAQASGEGGATFSAGDDDRSTPGT